MNTSQLEIFDAFILDPVFSALWPRDEQSIAGIKRNMAKRGFDESRPLLLGTGPWTDKPVLLDGHMRLEIARKLGIVNIPTITKHFSSWGEAAEEVARIQSFQQWREPNLSHRYNWLEDGKTCVCNMKRAEDKALISWAKERNLFVYVGRPVRSYGLAGSKWQNPFRAKTAAEACQKYEKYLMSKPELLADIHELRGRLLGCWCYPRQDCHGEILAEKANKI